MPSTLCEIDSTRSVIMLVSVQIVCGCWILKQWGLHEALDTGTLSEIYMYTGIVAGTIASNSSFNMPVELIDDPFSCEIGNSQNNSFQQCLTNVKVKDATKFASKYVRFWVESPKTQRSAQGEQSDMLSVLIDIHCIEYKKHRLPTCLGSPNCPRNRSIITLALMTFKHWKGHAASKTYSWYFLCLSPLRRRLTWSCNTPLPLHSHDRTGQIILHKAS